MNNIIIENSELVAEINPFGAELTSVRSKNGAEYMWDGNPEIWSGHAPVLFPICGSLKDDKYVYNGKEYTLLKHGFARKSMFECVRKEKAEAEFLLTPNEKISEGYPFDFELRVIFSLYGNKLKTIYKVINKDICDMYFGIGAHEAYACPEGISEYDIMFPDDICLTRCFAPVGKLVDKETKPFELDGNYLHLRDKYFEEDAMIFKNHKSRKVVLSNKERKITVDFDGFDYLLLWMKPGAGYICIEPWTCIPDYTDSDNILENKEGIIKLAPKGIYSVSHTICFE